MLDGFRSQRAALVDAAQAALEAAWLGLPGYDQGDIAVWLGQVVPLGTATRQQMTALTDAYLAAYTAEATGDAAARLAGLDAAAYARPVPPAKAWSRPFARMFARQAAGMPAGQAEAFGMHTAVQQMVTDSQLAHRGAARDWMGTDQRIVGYQRVIGSSKPCGLCIVASTMRYRSGSLMPIHSSCRCTSVPIFGTEPPGRVLDGDTLEYVKDRADGYTRQALSNLKIDAADLPPVKVIQHGELGPVLYSEKWELTAFAE